MATEEVWKPLNFETIPGKYQVSNFGHVRRSYDGLVIRGCTANGYVKVYFYLGANKYIAKYGHVLVAENFVEKVDGKLFVNHKDGNKTNNNYSNLEWVTMSENTIHAIRTGLMKIVKRGVAQLTRDGTLIAIYPSLSEAGRVTKVSKGSICRVCQGHNITAGGFRWEYTEPTPLKEVVDTTGFVEVDDFPNYMASPDGRVYSKFYRGFLKPVMNQSGYHAVCLYNGAYHGSSLLVHRVVAAAFISGRSVERNQVNHLNAVRTDNRVVNLEWVSPSENMIHRNLLRANTQLLSLGGNTVDGAGETQAEKQRCVAVDPQPSS
jgi:HNH endonuclease/NUMOD4 motif